MEAAKPDSQSWLDLSNRRVLVTGASGGLGRGVALLLASAGAEVILHCRRRRRRAEETLAEIQEAGGRGSVEEADLLQAAEIRKLFDRVRAGGHLDILVHGASLGGFKKVTDVRAHHWDLTIGTDPRAFLLAAKAAAEQMPDGGSIVALSSLGSQRVVPGYGAIGAAKAALESLVRSLAVELGPHGIRVNAVSAGPVEPSSVSNHPSWLELRDLVIKRTPFARIATPEEIAQVVLFLSSPLATWMTGQVLTADGGLTLEL